MNTLLEYGLLAVLVALLLAPLGFPIPEDVTLLSAGALSYNGHASLWGAYAVCWIGILCGDMMLWTLGRTVGLHPRGFIGRQFGKSRIKRISRFYRKFGVFAVMICRNLPGTRFPAFFFAGATRMPLLKFVILDGIAAILTVGVEVTLGHAFGDEIGRIAVLIGRFRTIASIGAVCVIAFLLWRLFRVPKDAPDEFDESPSEITDSSVKPA